MGVGAFQEYIFNISLFHRTLFLTLICRGGLGPPWALCPLVNVGPPWKGPARVSYYKFHGRIAVNDIKYTLGLQS
jgi:hypothetical protein